MLMIFLGLVGCAMAQAQPQCMFLGYPDLEYDGRDRTEVLNERSFNDTVYGPGANEVVFFNDVEADDDEYDQYECFLQLSAQILTRRGYNFYTVNTTKEPNLARQHHVGKGEDVILVFKDGYTIEYRGVRDPNIFVSWTFDIPDDPVSIINDDFDRKQFEAIADESVRVIGYFEPSSNALKEFEEAAEDFMGEVEFFAVVDSYWARKFGLRWLSEVHMYRPYEYEPLIAPSTTDTEEEFEDWVKNNKEPVMQKLLPQNYFDVWRDPEPDEKMIVAFVDEETREGSAMFDLLKQLANQNAELAGTLELVLIDPDEFPLMVDIWEEMFDIEIEEGPQIGLIDLSDQEGAWFDMTQINIGEAEKYYQSNLEVLQMWIDQIMSGKITLEDLPPNLTKHGFSLDDDDDDDKGKKNEL